MKWSGPLTLLLLILSCNPRNEFQPPPPPEVDVSSPFRRDIVIQSEYVGTLEAFDEVDVRARVQGFLNSIEFESGQFVEKGDLLFTIEPEPYIAQVNAAKARMRQAEAQVALAKTTFERNEELFEAQAISELEVLQRKAELEVATANKLEAEAALESAELNLSYTKVYAPLPGKANASTLSVGNLVQNGTLLVSIVSQDPLYATITVSEREIIDVLGNRSKPFEERNLPPVKIKLANGDIYEEEGEIAYAENILDSQTGTITCRAVFPNPNLNLIPGLYIDLLYPIEYNDVLVIPETSISSDMQGKYVLTIGQDNVVSQKYIVTGPLSGEERIVESGLTEEDQIIVSGLLRARPGIKVNPSKVAASSPKEPTPQSQPEQTQTETEEQ